MFKKVMVFLMAAVLCAGVGKVPGGASVVSATAITYYVSTSGNDSNTGTIGQPWRTIQKAAEMMQAGDTAVIREGTYRETVKPLNDGTEENPITFRAMENESVTINGSDSITGWTQHSGSIYKASVNLSLKDENQIFVDGEMMHEARWPNYGSGDILHPSLATMGTVSTLSGNRVSFNDTNMQNIDWTGATIWVWSGSKWCAWTSTVTDSDGSSVTFKSNAPDSWNQAVAGGNYYLSGKLEALDTPGEMYYDEGDSMLYVWVPDGGDPSNYIVEAKQRKYAFDLTDRSYVHIEGIDVFGSSITTSQAMGAYSAKVEGIHSEIKQTLYGLTPSQTYVLTALAKLESIGGQANVGVRNQGDDEVTAAVTSYNYSTVSVEFTTGPSSTSADIFLRMENDIGQAYGDGFGVKTKNAPIAAVGVDNYDFESGALGSWQGSGTYDLIQGADHIVIDRVHAAYVSHRSKSEEQYSSQKETGVILAGTNNELKNSEISYSSGSGVEMEGNHNRLVNNEISFTNYSGTYAASIKPAGKNHLISHNTAHSTGRSIVSIGGGKLNHSKIQYNDFYEGGYLSNDLGLFYAVSTDVEDVEIAYNKLHDNKAAAAGVGLYLDNSTHNFIVHHNVIYNNHEGIRLNLPGEFNLIYNNTVFNNVLALKNNWGYVFTDDTLGTRVFNNIFSSGVVLGSETAFGDNLYGVTDSEFVNASLGDFRLKSGSLAIDSGSVIAGITDSYEGSSPDIGAYEYEGEGWSAGSNRLVPPSPEYTVNTTSYRNRIKNSGFERQDLNSSVGQVLEEWTKTGNQQASVVWGVSMMSSTGNARASSKGIRIGTGMDGIEQEVTGLTPETTYHLSVWLKIPSGQEAVLGAKNTDGLLASHPFYSTDGLWERKEVVFTTGLEDTSVIVFLNKPSGTDYVYADDFGLIQQPELSNVTIQKNSPILEIGYTIQLLAKVLPVEVTGGIVWSSSNPGIATVDSGGIVEGIGTGNVTITAASALNSAISAEYELEIINPIPAVAIVDLGSSLSDEAGWKFKSLANNAAMNFPDGNIELIGQSVAGYDGSKYGDELLAFNARFDLQSSDLWHGIQLNGTKAADVPWNSNNGYFIVIKKDKLELQKWDNTRTVTQTFLMTMNNTAIQNKVWHQIQVGTVNTAHGVNVILNVDGNRVFSYFDVVNPITADGYLNITNYAKTPDDLIMLTAPGTDSPNINLIRNSSFENGTANWSPNGSSLATDTLNVHDGVKAAKVYGRVASWANVRQLVNISNGSSYAASAWVKLESGTDTARLVAAVNVGGTTYYRTIASAAVNSSGWVKLNGQYTFNEAGPIQSADLRIDTSTTMNSFYVDGVRLVEVVLPPPPLLLNMGFEDGTVGWNPNGSTLASETVNVHSGAKSIKVYNRTASWANVKQAVSLMDGNTYEGSAWVKLESGTDTARLAMAVNVGGTTYYRTIATATADSSGWIQLKGQYTFNEAGPITSADLRIYTSSTTNSFYVDDVSLEKM